MCVFVYIRSSLLFLLFSFFLTLGAISCSVGMAGANKNKKSHRLLWNSCTPKVASTTWVKERNDPQGHQKALTECTALENLSLVSPLHPRSSQLGLENHSIYNLDDRACKGGKNEKGGLG